MALWRTQDNVPNVYTDFSRDFQVLERAYDVIYNALLFDVDSVHRLTDTKLCNTNALALLQTKLGFFSNALFTDEELRYILGAFPTIVHNKGSLLGIRQTIYMYLKTQHMRTNVLVTITTDKPDNADYKPYQVLIGIESDVRSTTVLEEVLKYVLPTGYDLSFYFYSTSKTVPITALSDYATVLFLSDNINSSMFSRLDWEEITEEGTQDTYYRLNKSRFIDSEDSTNVIEDINKNAYRIINIAGTTNTYSMAENVRTVTSEGSETTKRKYTLVDCDVDNTHSNVTIGTKIPSNND